MPELRQANRELSRLDFYARVLAMAEDPSIPLLDRCKFVAIFSEHLDEFFQVRVAGLKEQLDAGVALSTDGLSPAEVLRAVRARVEDLLVTQAKVFLDDIVPALADAGIRLSDWPDLDADDRDFLVAVFEERIFPVLTPLAVDPGHPFPFVSNLSLNLAVIVRDAATDERRFARVKVPPLLPRFVVMPDGERFVPLEQVIAAHLGRLFPRMEIECHFPFRVTRNADLALEEEEADDLLAAIETELRRRRRAAVRLEIGPDMAEEVRDLLVRELELGPDDVFVCRGPLDLSGLSAVAALERADLKHEPWAPVTPAGLAAAEDDPVDLFAVLRERDVLVHHPYDSFATSVEAFISHAADDPDVLAIKQTLYRTGGDSPIVEALIRAAEQGKQVAVLVELKARGDEQANIGWARVLEDAGVHVVYGLVGLKTHAKAALVVREEDDGIRRYCHVGTGNYNSRTARKYEDLGLLTADRDLGADVAELFNMLTGYGRHTFRRIVVAPMHVRQRIVELIDGEAAKGAAGRITMKMNSFADPACVEAVHRAAAAGVRVDLTVRGVCTVQPGIEGLTETMRVRSIVGRFLEHSRIFWFGEPDDPDATVLMGSADLMERNLDRRVEALVPITEPALRARLWEVLEANLADDTLAWELRADGTWARLDGGTVNVQERLMDLARQRGRRRRGPDSLTDQID